MFLECQYMSDHRRERRYKRNHVRVWYYDRGRWRRWRRGVRVKVLPDGTTVTAFVGHKPPVRYLRFAYMAATVTADEDRTASVKFGWESVVSSAPPNSGGWIEVQIDDPGQGCDADGRVIHLEEITLLDDDE